MQEIIGLKKRSRVRKSDLPEIETELRRLEATRDGLTAEAVVKRAADKKNVMHRYFEWDDTEAAREYRLSQARGLIREVTVTYIDDGEEKEPIRAFVNVEHAGRRSYMYATKALSVLEIRQQVIDRALQDAEQWRLRWAHVKELEPIFEKIEEVTESLRGRKKRPKRKVAAKAKSRKRKKAS